MRRQQEEVRPAASSPPSEDEQGESLIPVLSLYDQHVAPEDVRRALSPPSSAEEWLRQRLR